MKASVQILISEFGNDQNMMIDKVRDMYLKESTIFIDEDLKKRMTKEKSKFTEFMERDEVNYTNARNKLLQLVHFSPNLKKAEPPSKKQQW